MWIFYNILSYFFVWFTNDFTILEVFFQGRVEEMVLDKLQVERNFCGILNIIDTMVPTRSTVFWEFWVSDFLVIAYEKHVP